MKFEDFNFEDDENEDLEDAVLDIDKIKNNITSYKIEKICEIIVCNRYFNFYQDLTVICMEELARRRLEGDSFNYEEYIENSYNELPKLNFTMPDLRSMLNQVIGSKSK